MECALDVRLKNNYMKNLINRALTKIAWEATGAGNVVYDNGKGRVFLSYNPNDFMRHLLFNSLFTEDLDGANPETAIVIRNDKRLSDGTVHDRCLIFRGDKRKELQALYPNIGKLKAYWRKYGGHFWSDNLHD